MNMFMLLQKKEWPPVNIHLLKQILQDYDSGNSILLGDYHECNTCGAKIDLKDFKFTGGIIVDRFLSDGNPGQIKLFCRHCWWNDSDMRTKLYNVMKMIRGVRLPIRQAELKKEQEEEQQRKKGVVIYHAEKLLKYRWRLK